MKRTVAHCMMAGLLVTLTLTPSYSQEYPTKAITMVVPFPAGGRTDLVGRLVAQFLQPAFGKPVAVLNKPGASGVLGALEVAEAKPDGYVLGFFSSALITAQYTVPTPISLSQFELISVVNADPAALAVNADSPFQTTADLVAAAKKAPGTLRMATIPGASAQIFAAGFARASGIDVINVPFKGDADGAIALAGNHVDIHMAVPVSYLSLVAAKKLRILGLAADVRSEFYGNLPTLREGGVPFTIDAFHAVYVPKGTSEAIKTRITAALKVALGNPDFQKRMAEIGAAPVFIEGDEAQAYLHKQDETYRNVIDALGLRVKPSN